MTLRIYIYIFFVNLRIVSVKLNQYSFGCLAVNLMHTYLFIFLDTDAIFFPSEMAKFIVSLFFYNVII